MAKVLDIESGQDVVEQTENDKKEGFKSLIENTMKQSYVMGLQNGARAMCVAMLAEIKKNEKRSIKKQVEAIRMMCLRNMQKNEQSNQNEKENDHVE